MEASTRLRHHYMGTIPPNVGCDGLVTVRGSERRVVWSEKSGIGTLTTLKSRQCDGKCVPVTRHPGW